MNKPATKQPQIIALRDFRLHTQSFIDKIADGQSFIVVKRSKPVFRLEPIDKS